VQSSPQEIPARLDVTVPGPLPAFVTITVNIGVASIAASTAGGASGRWRGEGSSPHAAIASDRESHSHAKHRPVTRSLLVSSLRARRSQRSVLSSVHRICDVIAVPSASIATRQVSLIAGLRTGYRVAGFGSMGCSCGARWRIRASARHRGGDRHRGGSRRAAAVSALATSPRETCGTSCGDPRAARAASKNCSIHEVWRDLVVNTRDK